MVGLCVVDELDDGREAGSALLADLRRDGGTDWRSLARSPCLPACAPLERKKYINQRRRRQRASGLNCSASLPCCARLIAVPATVLFGSGGSCGRARLGCGCGRDCGGATAGADRSKRARNCALLTAPCEPESLVTAGWRQSWASPYRCLRQVILPHVLQSVRLLNVSFSLQPAARLRRVGVYEYPRPLRLSLGSTSSRPRAGPEWHTAHSSPRA